VLFAWEGLEWQSSYLCLPHSWDYRCDPTWLIGEFYIVGPIQIPLIAQFSNCNGRLQDICYFEVITVNI
jgi:hypothetical protein